MTCTEVRVALLEADLDELRGTAGTPLALHVRACADCRVAAERVVRVEDAMGRRLAEFAPGHPVPAASARLGRRHHPWRWAVSLAAAATIVALIVRPGQGPSPRDAPSASEQPGPGRVAVEAPPGRNVAVFETADPDIVIIWFF